MNNLSSRPWHALNINISNAVRKDFNFDEALAKTHAHKTGQWLWSFHKPDLLTIFNEEWLAYMKSLDLEVFSTLMFYRSPLFVGEPHIDLPTNFAINWVLDDQDSSEMVWYKLPSEVDYANDSRTAPTGGYVYLPLDLNTLVETDRRTISMIPTLIRTDIPHSIYMQSSPRWALSVRVDIGKRVGGSISWDEALAFFNSYIQK